MWQKTKAPAAATRRELKRYIDAIPESNLEIVRPMLSFLAGSKAADEPLVIETDLTVEEKAVVNAGRMERKKSAKSFTPWSAVKESSINSTNSTF